MKNLRTESLDRSWTAPAALAIACLVWGSAMYFGKLALVELGPLEVTGLRFAIAAPVFAVIVLASRVRRRDRSGLRRPARALPTRREAGLIVLTGVLCVPVGYLIHFVGLDRTTATHAALLVGTGPPLLGLTAWGLGLEELRRKDWAAIVLSVLGVTVMVGIPSAGGDLLGDALVLLSMAISTAWVLLSQRLARSLGAAVATAWILLAGTVAVAPLFVVTGLPSLALEPRTWLALLALGLGCTVGSFLLWNWGATRLSAGRAGVFLNLEPVSGVLLGVFLLGETAGVPVLVGGAIVTSAAVLASTGGAPESARARGRLRGREQQDARPPGAEAAREALSSPPKRSTERRTRTGTYEPNAVIACRRDDRRRDPRTSARTGSRG